MKKGFRLIIPAIMACFTLSGCELFSGKSTSKDYGAYYKGYDLSLKGGKLANELQVLCFAKHTHWVSYAQVNSYYAKRTTADGYYNSVEAIEDGSDQNQWFYTGLPKSGYGTREHVWPCANSGGLWEHGANNTLGGLSEADYIGGGSDLFHVRTCDSNVNSARGNSNYVDFDDPEMSKFSASDIKTYPTSGGGWKLKLQGLDSNNEYAKYCEPDDNMKGDIARIVAYVWLHYSARGANITGEYTHNGRVVKYTEMTGNLALPSIMGYTDLNRCKEKLKEWNKLDVPSAIEKLRNDTVQNIQGNRNPFVDYPELMDQIF